VSECLLKVQGCCDSPQRETELDQGAGNIGLYANHHRVGATNPRGVRDRSESACRERVQDVERRDVDDHASAPESPDSVRELFATLNEILA
jgi:hypothetical protein